MRFQLVAALIISTILVGCGGQSGGLAPSKSADAPSLTAITDVSDSSNIKFGKIVTSTNGWEMSIDTTDPVEEVTLASGWNVEVKYE